MTITMQDTETPSAWVGCLGCYNSGRLFGKWLDGLVCDDLEAAGLAEILTIGEYTAPRCVKCGADEFWVMDHENYGGALSGECNPTEAREAAELLASAEDYEREAWVAWLDNGMPADLEEMRECYIGEFSSDTELGEYFADECGLLDEMPESLRRYFDYESYGRDLAHDTFEVSGYYFWNRWAMSKLKLTRRGKILRAALIAALIAGLWWAGNATTPKECRVPVSEMPQFCITLLYP